MKWMTEEHQHHTLFISGMYIKDLHIQAAGAGKLISPSRVFCRRQLLASAE
jgi:hypothetical protein